VQKTEPLCTKLYIHYADACYVAARPIQASDKAGLNWVPASPKNNWNGHGGGFPFAERYSIATFVPST